MGYSNLYVCVRVCLVPLSMSVSVVEVGRLHVSADHRSDRCHGELGEYLKICFFNAAGFQHRSEWSVEPVPNFKCIKNPLRSWPKIIFHNGVLRRGLVYRAQIRCIAGLARYFSSR